MKSDRSPSPQDSPLSIVHQPSSAIDPAREPEYLEAAVINVYPQAEDLFFTPWGIRAMVIFLIANSLLSLNQWLTNTTPTPRKTENSPLEQRQNNSRHLDRLIAIARPVQKTPQTSPIVNIPAPPVKTSPIANIPAPPVVQSPPTAINLTNALLPPNPPPSPMPAHQLPVSKIKQSLPVAPPNPSTPPVSSLVSAPPPPPPQVTPAPSTAIINERMLEELRQREESPANLPFFQREKARRLANQNRQEAVELMKQLPPELQASPSPSSPAPSETADPSQSNSLIQENQDPEKLLEKAILAMEGELMQMRQALAAAVATQKRTERQRQQQEKAAQTWHERAQLALHHGNEELARQALSQWQTYQSQIAPLQTSLQQQTAIIQKLKKELLTIERKYAEMKAQPLCGQIAIGECQSKSPRNYGQFEQQSDGNYFREIRSKSPRSRIPSRFNRV